MFNEIGVGVLIHNSHRYEEYVKQIDDDVDAYEVVMGQFIEEPEELRILKAQLNKPIILHTIALSLGTDAPVDTASISRVNRFLNILDSPWYGDHICFTEVPGNPSSALLPPILTEESLQIFLTRLHETSRLVGKPPVLENTVMHYNPIGTMTYPQYINRILSESDAGLLLSIQNITNSCQRYYPLDHYAFIDSLDLDKVVEIHCTVGSDKKYQEEEHQDLRADQQLHMELIEYLAKTKKVRPKAFIWELEDGLEHFPEADELKEKIQWVKQLFFQ